ncbi:MAG: hypothetical protein RIR59_1436 [Pseudomonadota bacterium]
MQTGNPHGDAHWVRWLFGLWLLMSAILLAFRWQNIDFLILADTDDNLRLAQVKAWLGGQGWYDLRQYRLDPPRGADIHWSRLPDLPIAGLIAGLSPLVGSLTAEKIAIALAPLLPFGLGLFAMALTARRLLAPQAWVFGAALLFCAPSVLGMFVPTRIDHHGWQLAFLALTLAGLVDHRPQRGGMTAGLATAASLSVGLEMLPYLALCGALMALAWLVDATQKGRLRLYGIALSAGTALGYAVFASEANRAARCDALSPVWLSTMVVCGALLMALSAVTTRSWRVRALAGAVAAGLIAGLFAWAWPQCLGRPEGLPDTLYQQWFVNIIEVRPLYKHDLTTALSSIALPISGLLGALWMLWRHPAHRLVWGQFVVLGAVSIAMLFWQLRAAPAAQLLAIPGATALAWHLIPPMSQSPRRLVRVFGVAAAFLMVSGLAVYLLVRMVPTPPEKPVKRVARKASAQCTTLSALRPVARLAPGTVFTLVDLSPRLIAVTPHKAIAGPYHRNSAAILDVFDAFRKDAATARRIILAHGADYVLICPNMAEANNHRRAGPKGFLAQLQKGQVPAWLVPVTLPQNASLQMWRVVRDPAP